MIWIDASGRSWEIVDFHRPNLSPRANAKRLPISDPKAEGRSFIPVGWNGPTMLYDFGRIAYRDTSDRTVEQQLSRTYRAGAPTADRLNPSGPPIDATNRS